MDYLRVLLVPFAPSSLLLVGTFSLLSWIVTFAGLYGLIAALFLQIWMFKYCFVLIEHIADGATEPPVMSTDILSPMEFRPWVQFGLLLAGGWLCYQLDDPFGFALAPVLGALIPAQLAILGLGERPWQTVNPLTIFRLIKGLGPYYLLLLAALAVYGALFWLLMRSDVWLPVTFALTFASEISFFGLVGGALYWRRVQLDSEPSRSPERVAARAATEREQERARMVDEVFQLVRIGRLVDATKPLAAWIQADADEHIVEDAYHVVEQSLRWDSVKGLNTIGSTLIRHLLRARRREAALAVYERLRGVSTTLTLDSALDLRELADYADSLGRKQLAQSMRLETPIVKPIARSDT